MKVTIRCFGHGREWTDGRQFMDKEVAKHYASSILATREADCVKIVTEECWAMAFDRGANDFNWKEC